MKTKRYISYDNMPPHGIVTTPLLWWLFADYFDSPQWVVCVIVTYALCVSVLQLHKAITYTPVDLFKGSSKE